MMKQWILKTCVFFIAFSFGHLSYSFGSIGSATKNEGDEINKVVEEKINYDEQGEDIRPSTATANGNSRSVSSKLDTILNKLQQIETKLGCDMDSFIDGSCNQNPASASATFCISQGRAMELGLEYAVEAPVEWELGVGWAEVGDAKATIAPVHPTIIPNPIGLIPIILPNSVKVGAAGNLGRGMDICIDIPIVLSRDDTARLAEVARDMNTPGVLDTTKFQRRAGRILNYAAVRVGGNQRFDLSINTAQTASTQYDDGEFDRIDDAVTNLLDDGWTVPSNANGFSAFRDNNVLELLSSMELPVGVNSVLRDPEQIFDSLPDGLAIDQITCNTFGVSSLNRSNRPKLDRLCTQLETLPSFDIIKDGLERVGDIPNDVVDAITNIIEPLLSEASVKETAVQSKSRFCNTAVGQRRIFNKLCNR